MQIHCESVELNDCIHKLNAIGDALVQKDPDTHRHALRVARYAMRLARRIGLSYEETCQIGIGGMLHDIGKIGMSDDFFSSKSKRRCNDIRQEAHLHPAIGVSLLKDIKLLSPVLDYIYYHHERVDGKGYPCGLKANQIPLGAKIIAVADWFDAMTSHRPYQSVKSPARALEMMRQAGGTHLCPQLVEAFVEEIEENGTVRDMVSEPPAACIPAHSTH
jgi:putative nucleotidyltransferase with HDIG domain